MQDCLNDHYLRAPPEGSAWLRGKCYVRVRRGGVWSHGAQYIRSSSRSWAST